MKPTTIAIILIVLAVLAVVVLSSDLDFKGADLSVYAGRLKVNLLQVKTIDGTTYGVEDSYLRMIHGSMDYNDKVGTISSLSVTGDLKDADHGTWYLCIDYGTNTTFWLDHTETLKEAYVTRIFGQDGDQDGFNEEYIELDFSGLGALKAGESQKEVEVTIQYCPSRVSGITFTSLANATGISTSAYGYKAATGYMTGFTEGDLAKIAKVELLLTTGNETYPDLQYWKLTHLSLGAYSWTASSFGNYDLANKRYQLLFGDQINHQNGKPAYMPKNAITTTWATYELKAYCKFPSGSKTITITIKVYMYQPDGTTTSAFTRAVTFAS